MKLIGEKLLDELKIELMDIKFGQFILDTNLMYAGIYSNYLITIDNILLNEPATNELLEKINIKKLDIPYHDELLLILKNLKFDKLYNYTYKFITHTSISFQTFCTHTTNFDSRIIIIKRLYL